MNALDTAHLTLGDAYSNPRVSAVSAHGVGGVPRSAVIALHAPRFVLPASLRKLAVRDREVDDRSAVDNQADHIETNRRTWDQRVPIHIGSTMYGRSLAALEAGGHCLDPVIVEEMGDVREKSLLHLQCHIGHDTLSWARLGARVTGLDFSRPAIEAARRLAGTLEIDARFVCADVYDAAEAIGERFDVVFASEGVFCWVPDLVRWMRVAAALLKSGGMLYVMDGHPFADLIGERPDVPEGIGITEDYFDPGPYEYGPGPSYASDEPDQTVGASVEWGHTISDFVNAVAAAGLRIQSLHEYPRHFFRRFQSMELDEHGRWKLPGALCDRVPLVLSIRAIKE